jgi:cardiolipin-specific phospholipase
MEQTHDARNHTKEATSISWSQSIKDWWRSSSKLQRPYNSQIDLTQDLLKNRIIEYELFRKVLSQDILLVSPQSGEQDIANCQFLGKFIDTKINDLIVIHEFCLQANPPNDGQEQHLVIIHGYMAALGYFVTNLEPLIKQNRNLIIHVIDLPGFGNSSRPKFPNHLLVNHDDKLLQINQIIEIENWFIDNIEKWRKLRNINHFKLIGHSMGAYLSCCYLLKYNTRENGNPVDHVMLVSPMGTESSSVSLINHQNLQFNHHGIINDPLKEFPLIDDERLQDLQPIWQKIGKPKFPTNSILKFLWEHNLSPFRILSYLGPFFSKFLSIGSFKRFRHLPDKSFILKLHHYSYSIFSQYPYSGEIAITKLVNHEILARLPLCDRGLVEHFVENNVYNIWLYGDKDWMNDQGGLNIVDKIKSFNKNLTAYKIIDNAGHHIYLDNSDLFVKCCIEHLHLESD